MAGTAKSYNTNYVEIGPADIWLDVAVPGAGGRITLHTDGTPESVANPSALHLGMTLEGSRVIYTPNVTEFESDELTAPIIVQNVGEVLAIEGTMLQVLDTLIAIKLMAGGTRSTGSGYEEISLGGKQTVPTFTVAVIAPIYADTTKFVVFNIYKAWNSAGWQMDLSRKKMSSVPFSFKAQAISSRAQGDQNGKYWKTVT